MELNSRLADLQSRFGEHNLQIISARADLAAANKQIDAEVGHVLAAMKNAYDIAVRREQTLEANLQSLTANLNSETYLKLQQLRHAADADRKDYESYLAQYNNIIRTARNAVCKRADHFTGFASKIASFKSPEILCSWRRGGSWWRFTARLPAGIF